ncbi:hypothetical protein GLOTRDRAFT_134412 [Gloeophyllum trabeum ATCC 11539]|uniref:Uncharacterized protein n=1 Tax=Gloeophyllum trabeum (strain ATCC 11539 / FP-39264 / Madison 617) TaxID=670483 RepID=S7PR50_GLOTA|nr:uncharacterized protein GLOTRDRAFT_134412 [Gloeophyllum trabeum ATCC 11539]EPQ49953.1 hypothetical protein GLOTRDRAFT_134412 [Gloeophyllum trabeum ATCC 11539]
MLTVIDILFTKVEATCLSSPQAMSSPINAGAKRITDPDEDPQRPRANPHIHHRNLGFNCLGAAIPRIDSVSEALPAFECREAALYEETTQEEKRSMLTELTNLPDGEEDLVATVVHPAIREMKARPQITSSLEVGTSNTSPTTSDDFLPTTPTDDDGASTVVGSGNSYVVHRTKGDVGRNHSPHDA